MSSDSRSVMEQIKDEIAPSVLSGAIGVLGANMLLGVDVMGSINIANMNVPTWVGIAGVIGGSVLLSEVSHDWVLEKLPENLKGSWLTYENRLLAPALAGASTYLLFRFGVSDGTSIVNSVALGAGSSIMGNYAYDTFNAYEGGSSEY